MLEFAENFLWLWLNWPTVSEPTWRKICSFSFQLFANIPEATRIVDWFSCLTPANISMPQKTTFINFFSEYWILWDES